MVSNIINIGFHAVMAEEGELKLYYIITGVFGLIYFIISIVDWVGLNGILYLNNRLDTIWGYVK